MLNGISISIPSNDPLSRQHICVTYPTANRTGNGRLSQQEIETTAHNPIATGVAMNTKVLERKVVRL